MPALFSVMTIQPIPKRGIGPLKIPFCGDTGAEFIKRRRSWLT